MTAVNPFLLGIVLTQAVICAVGFTMNIFFVFVVIRNKKLRSHSCGIFLMVLACCDSIAEMTMIFVPPYTHLANTTIPLKYCFLVGLFSPLADQVGYSVIFFISIDRLLGVFLPVQSRRISTKYKIVEVVIAIFLASIYSVYMISRYYWETVAINPDQKVNCLPSDFMQENALQTFNNVCTAQFICAFINYCIIWILIRRKGFAEQQTDAESRINKSLFVLMGLILGCMLPVPIIRNFVLPNLPFSADAINVIGRFIILPIKIAGALEVPALYFCSSDHRAAMQKELRRIFKCFTAVRLAQSNAVANANIQHVDVNFSTVYGPNTPNMMVTRMTEK